MFRPANFIREVKREASKVTWASKKDTITTSVVVFVMVIFMALFFWLVDTVLYSVVYDYILNLV